MSPGGTSPLHTALSLCQLELQRNGKNLQQWNLKCLRTDMSLCIKNCLILKLLF